MKNLLLLCVFLLPIKSPAQGLDNLNDTVIHVINRKKGSFILYNADWKLRDDVIVPGLQLIRGQSSDSLKIEGEYKRTLDELAIFLKVNPGVVIGLRAFRNEKDSREKLKKEIASAKSIYDYLINKKDVNASQLVPDNSRFCEGETRKASCEEYQKQEYVVFRILTIR
jgi:hypothetical protein